MKLTPVDFVMKETGKPAKGKRRKKSSAAPAKPSGPTDSRIEKALRAWRLEEARRRGVPAFRILTDKVLREIVITHPTTSDQLLAISGMGMSTVEKYGPSIHRIVNERRGGRKTWRQEGNLVFPSFLDEVIEDVVSIIIPNLLEGLLGKL